MTTTRLLPWFGADTAVCEAVGKAMGDPAWACVLFAGGCSVLPYLKCRAGVANDLHRHLINAARVVANPEMCGKLVERLSATLFHPDELADAQTRCLDRQASMTQVGMFGEGVASVSMNPVDWAYDYLITGWMARSGLAGTDGEFRGSLPTRWNANGGGSNTRFRSIIASLDAWQKELARWEWECLDCFEMLGKIKDAPGKAIYADPPWPEQGDGYRHKFTENNQRRLARELSHYQHAKIVIRYGDHPLIRELYPAPRWHIIEHASRDQANQSVPEILIVNAANV